MYSLLDLAGKIEPDVARDPDRDPEPAAPPWIGPSLRSEILFAIKSNSAHEAQWKSGSLEERHKVLTLVLRASHG